MFSYSQQKPEEPRVIGAQHMETPCEWENGYNSDKFVLYDWTELLCTVFQLQPATV